MFVPVITAKSLNSLTLFRTHYDLALCGRPHVDLLSQIVRYFDRQFICGGNEIEN